MLHMKGVLFSGASSPHTFPTLYKGTILFLQVRDLTPVGQGMLKGKHTVKATVENPAAPAPASKTGAGHCPSRHGSDTGLCHSCDAGLPSSKSARLGRSHLTSTKLTLCFDTIEGEEISALTLPSGKRKLETVFRVPFLCSLGSRICIKLG